MSRKRKSNPEETKRQERELFNLFYEHEDEIQIEQYNEYHFRVFSKKSQGLFVDVWCVSKKYWQPRTMTGSKVYKSVREILPLLNIK